MLQHCAKPIGLCNDILRIFIKKITCFKIKILVFFTPTSVKFQEIDSMKMSAIFHGDLAPHLSYLKAFSLVFHAFS
jgi:hypothetical protein